MITRSPGDRDDGARDQESFTLFVRTHTASNLAPVARRYAAVSGLPDADATEILSTALQRVWEKAWPELAAADDQHRLRKVYRFMQLVTKEQRKKANRAVLVDPLDLPERTEGDDPYLRVENRMVATSALVALVAALDELSDEDREIIELAGIAGMSHSEIAEQLGLTPTNVSTKLKRARDRLKDKVGIDMLAELGIGRLPSTRKGGRR